MRNLVVTEEIWKEGNMYTAYCPALDVVSCGRDIEEARRNLLEVIEIQLEEAAKLGTLRAFFEKFGCRYVRQKGSHLIYHYPNIDYKGQVAIHSTREIPETVEYIS